MAATYDRETTAGFSGLQGSRGISSSEPIVLEPIPSLTIAFHPDWSRIGERYVMSGLLSGRKIRVSRIGPGFESYHPPGGGPLADPFLSRGPLIFKAGPSGDLHLNCSESRTHLKVLGYPKASEYTFSRPSLEQGVPILLANRVVLLLHFHQPLERPKPKNYGMVGTSTALERVRAAIERVADLDFPLLIRGESGTGKEMVAKAIYREGARRNQPMVSVNMAAIPPSLAASELFGAMRGAYSGAMQNRDGFFRRAHGGVLFLDEIGETPPEIQPMLLRALETGDIHPVGSPTAIRVDVRVLAATDADLEDMTTTGSFKSPLLHRLAGYVIRIPPLRERREDIGPLLRHFFEEELSRVGELEKSRISTPKQEPWPPAREFARLIHYHWPGNVRELHNLVRQIVIDNRGSDRFTLDPEIDHTLDLEAPAPAVSAGATIARTNGGTSVGAAVHRKPRDISETELREALQNNHWDLKPTAQQLHISRPSLYKLMKKFEHIRTAGELRPGEIIDCFHECQGDFPQMAARLEVSAFALKRRARELGLI